MNEEQDYYHTRREKKAGKTSSLDATTNIYMPRVSVQKAVSLFSTGLFNHAKFARKSIVVHNVAISHFSNGLLLRDPGCSLSTKPHAEARPESRCWN